MKKRTILENIFKFNLLGYLDSNENTCAKPLHHTPILRETVFSSALQADFQK